MDRSERKQVVDLLKTIKIAIQHAKLNIGKSQPLIDDSSEALKSIADFLMEKESDYNLESILKCREDLKKYSKLDKVNKKRSLISLEKSIEKLIKSTSGVKKKEKIKALFLPYKASMWTALESIWKAADSDPNCEATVVPIPYHELNENMEKTNLCYEGEEYPDYVPIKKFWEYRIQDEKPDMIFIHNPYDDTNTLTRIPDEYYSRNLKKYTDMLVYSPYNTFFLYNPNEIFPEGKYEVTKYADKIVAQNNIVKSKYEECEHNKGKILALGSPKIDAIVNIKDNIIPKEWKEKVKNRTVFLLNTTLTFIVKYKEKAIERILQVYNEVTKNKNCLLIWRPHPLESAWIKKNIPGFLESYSRLKKMINECENSIVDESSDYRIAMSISQAMFSTFGSLIHEFMATGKPIYIIENYMNLKVYKYFVDYSWVNYIDKKNLAEFINDILSGEEDKNYEKRINAFNNSFINGSTGTCGKEVYNAVKNEVLKKLKGDIIDGTK